MHVYVDEVKITFTVPGSWAIEQLAAHPGTWQPATKPTRDALVKRGIVTIHPEHPKHIALTELGQLVAAKMGMRAVADPAPAGSLFSGTHCWVSTGDNPQLIRNYFGARPELAVAVADYWIHDGETLRLMPFNRQETCQADRTHASARHPAVAVVASQPMCAACAEARKA